MIKYKRQYKKPEAKDINYSNFVDIHSLEIMLDKLNQKDNMYLNKHSEEKKYQKEIQEQDKKYVFDIEGLVDL